MFMELVLVWNGQMLIIREGNKPIFCKPDYIPINAEGFYQIFAKEYFNKPEIYKDMPLAVPLIYGMISTYPCE